MSEPTNARVVGEFRSKARRDHLIVQPVRGGGVQIRTTRHVVDVPAELVLPLVDEIVDACERLAEKRKK